MTRSCVGRGDRQRHVGRRAMLGLACVAAARHRAASGRGGRGGCRACWCPRLPRCPTAQRPRPARPGRSLVIKGGSPYVTAPLGFKRSELRYQGARGRAAGKWQRMGLGMCAVHGEYVCCSCVYVCLWGGRGHISLINSSLCGSPPRPLNSLGRDWPLPLWYFPS